MTDFVFVKLGVVGGMAAVVVAVDVLSIKLVVALDVITFLVVLVLVLFKYAARVVRKTVVAAELVV